jgi:hypothetical protein
MSNIAIENQFVHSHGYDVFVKSIMLFRAKANKSGLIASEHILYNKLRNLSENRGFTDVTNLIKINNGAEVNLSFKEAKKSLNYDLKYNKNKFLEFGLDSSTLEYFQ